MKKLHLFKTVLLLCALIVGSSSVWADKITNYTNIVSGKRYYIGATTGGNDYYLSVNGSSTSTSIAGTAVTSKGSATPFTFSGSGTSWTIQFESGYYLSLKNGKDNGKVQVVESASTFTASNQSGNKIRLTIGGYSVQKNNSGTQFGSYGNTQTDIWLEEVDVTPAFTITAQSNNIAYGTVSLSGSVITGAPKSGCRYASPAYTVTAGTATVSQDGNAFSVSPKSDCTVTINFEAIPTHTATFSVNGKISETKFAEGASIEFPADPADISGKKFVGWVTATIVGTTDDEPSFVTSATMGEADITYYAVFATLIPGTGTVKYDNLTTGTFGNPSSYTSWSNKKAADGSDAIYAGESSGGSSFIQIRATSPSGIVTTTSGGKAKKVTITWNDDTTSGRTLEIYGKNTAYTGSVNLYNDSDKGTKLGSIVYGTSTELTITGDYEYIGMRSNYGAMYLDKIVVDWQTGTPDTYSAYCTSLPTVEVTITDAKYATFCYARELNVEGTGVTAYTASANGEGEAVTLTKISNNIIPANTGVILFAETTGNYEINVSETGKEDEAIAGNELVGVTTRTSIPETSAGKYNYIFSKKGDVIGFYRASGAYLLPNRAYLSTSKRDAAAREFMAIMFDEGETTSLREVRGLKTDVRGEFFNLNGQRVATPVKGNIYIVNGKKVMFK